MQIKNVLLGTLLGDSYIAKKNQGRYGAFRVMHGVTQLDYLNHIADLIRQDFKQHVSVYYRAKKKAYELYHHEKYWLEWRSRYYPDEKKSLINILKDVDDPILAVSYWLMDDGCVHYSTKNKTYLSPRILIATCSENKETHEFMIQWFKDNLQISPYITIQRSHKLNSEWMLLKFTVGDSYKLWQKVRHHILQIDSMKHKFRIVEQEFKKDFYRKKYFQEGPTSESDENVRRTQERS